MDYSNSVFSSEGNIREEVKRDKINGVLKIKELDAKKPVLLQVLEEFYKRSNNASEAGNNQEGKEKDVEGGGAGVVVTASPAADVAKVEKQPKVKE